MDFAIHEALQKAVNCHRTGQVEEAERIYRAILEAEPTNLGASHNLAVIAFASGRRDEGLFYLDRALSKYPSSPQLWITYTNQLIESHKFESAKHALEKAAKLGVTREQLLQFEEKLQRLSREFDNLSRASIISKKPKQKRVHSRNKSKDKKFNICPAPTNQEVENLLKIYSRGNYEEGGAKAKEFIERYPNHPLGWKILGLIFLTLKRPTEALNPMCRAVQLQPKDPAVHSNLALTFGELGRLAEAESSYREAIRLKPDFAHAHNNLGNVLRELRRMSEAEASYREAIRLNPNFFQAYNNLGNTLKELGRLIEAEDNYRKSILLSPKYALAHCNLGGILRELGRLLESEASCRTSISLSPNFTQAYCNLGMTLCDLGRFDEAEKYYREAIRLFPGFAQVHNNLGNMLRVLDRLTEADASYREAIRLKPDLAEAHSNLGNTLRDVGRQEEAEASCREAIRLKPDMAEAHSNLSSILRDLGRQEEAEVSCREAIRLKPDMAEAHSNLGSVLKELGRLNDAEISCRRAISLNPNLFLAYTNLGLVLADLGRLDEAVAYCNEAIRLKPDLAELHNNLGKPLKELARFDEAEASYRRAISLKPAFAEAHSNLGNILKELGRLVEAEASYRYAISLKTNLAEAYCNLGLVLGDLRRISEAEDSLREAIKIKSDYNLARFNLLFLLNYDPRRNAPELFKEYENYATFVRSSISKTYSHQKNTAARKERLRIGYSSPDFKNHSVRQFIEPIFKYHDKEQLELYAYSNVLNPDAHTKRLQGYFDCWTEVYGLNDSQMAEKIYDDKIDVLVDLAGPTKGNRLPVFAMKPASIQVAYPIGAGYTTGLSEIDYIFGDENLMPEGCNAYFSENIWRLPAPYMCFSQPLGMVPDINDLPALKNGYITFGSMSRTIRINDGVLSAWKLILECVPNSKLIINQRVFSDFHTQKTVFSQLEELGLPVHRINLLNSSPHWNGYHDIDISLDCFPHNAGTTTFDSLWMGVPVLSMLGRPSLGRIGASILSPLGLKEWVAKDEEDYVQKAISFSEDKQQLQKIRKSLRKRIIDSALLNPRILTHNMEKAFKGFLA